MSQSVTKRFRIPIAISSWFTFVVSLTLYWITADPGVSYWDCPEYVASASRLEIGHPPGNPIWMLAMRVATIPFPAAHHAYVINLCSGLFMAFASFFLCRIISVPTLLYFNSKPFSKNTTRLNAGIIAGLISSGSSLCFALCDSAWFSAVEAEVYAMSIFLTSLSLWIMETWWFEKSKSRQTRLLILLAYITGLSLGVHQLNLLLIPVFSLIILYKRYPGWINPLIVLSIIIVSIGLIGIILFIFIPGILFGAENFELFAVNSLGMPYHSGVIIFLILLLCLIIISLITTNHFKYTKMNYGVTTGIWAFTFLLLGFSSFGIILIRGAAYPPMNEGSPDNIFALTSYINRDQYPKEPLLYGHTPYSRPMMEETYIDGKPQYTRYLLEKGKGTYQPYMDGAVLNHRSRMLTHEDSLANKKVYKKKHGYLLSDYKFSQQLSPELDMWFPRMTSLNIADRQAYMDWGDMIPEKMERVAISETVDSTGRNRPKADMWGNRPPVYSYRPTYYQNLRYFVTYQAYYMYFRYLFWNFIGRQNDYPSNGEIEHGNFITGIPLIDNVMIGDTGFYPSEIWKGNKGRNIYFGIPFILGIVGIIFLLSGRRRERRYLTLILILFLMTGLAIVVYLNQGPGEPRERDYTFLGSYMAFAMWIAAGMTCIIKGFLNFKLKKGVIFISVLICMGIPTLMAVENFDDHDRRGRYEPTFYASSLLDFEEPAIIFSYGDNSTFPLWYSSEVLDKGKEHTIVDVTYLTLPSYIENLRKQGKNGISLIGESSELLYGNFILTYIPHDSASTPIGIDKAIRELYNSRKTTPEWISSLIIIPSGEDSLTINLHDFSKGSSLLSFKHLMLLDMLASHKKDSKVLFFPYLSDYSFYKALDTLLRPALFGKIYAPDLSDKKAQELLAKSVARELDKLKKLNPRPHYTDPLLADRSVRYRGELIIAAKEILNSGNKELPLRIVDAIETYYPYSWLLPGNFTMTDTTFYEGREYIKLLKDLYISTGEEKLKNSAENIESLMNDRREEWLEYYHSLSPSQRRTLSNRSKRMLVTPK